MITLGRGALEIDISPEIGGAVTRLDCGDVPVLRHGGLKVLDASCFPLVPVANRIENGVFKFGGKEYRLPLNFADHPHALHGHGWQTAWRVETVSRDKVAIAYDHARDAWPWAYSAEQVFSMTDDAVSMVLTLRSQDDKPMPYSLGLHPYFPRRPGSKVTAKVDGMWRADSTMIPTELVAATDLIDLNAGQIVSKAPFVDNTFTGWQGPARIEQPELGLEIMLKASANCGFFHVFIPEGEDYFCAEPTTAMPNALNRPESAGETGAGVLEPGQTVSMEMHISVRKL
ncbi:aldose 1-epimerase [Rhizomicrobium palustre]|uniref:Aldose 1-epimerase n=1 Tax=Rhizomicrobium palustre TaxID=189966 RepID=A0A846MV27_9PROT|nr:aldose 1-epimerase [Rhizomicrobium palustre]NIK87304.1 aldose 1-epimerase [Rhizomicrobium palustre]